MQRIFLLMSVIAALVTAAPAYAQDPVADAYGGAANAGSAAAKSPGEGTANAATAAGEDAGVRRATAGPAATEPLRGDELPFTGLDIALLALGGGVLLALGFGLRRLGRAPAA